MPEAYIVDAVRTPVGKRGGSLTPADVADQYLTILLEGISQ